MRIAECGLRNLHSAFSLRRSPERDKIVQIKQIEKGLYVVPIRRKFLHRTAQEFATIVIRRTALKLELAPRCNLEIGTFTVFANPGQNLGIRFSFFQEVEDILGVQPGKPYEALIEPAVELIVADLAGELSASFIQHAWQDHVSTKSYARAAGRALSEVDRVHDD